MRDLLFSSTNVAAMAFCWERDVYCFVVSNFEVFAVMIFGPESSISFLFFHTHHSVRD